MNGPGARDSVSKDGQARRRLTGFVLASLGLHAILLIAVQLVAQRRPVTVAPEPLPVQFVELEPPAGMEAPVPQEIPDQPPQEVPHIPEPQPDQPTRPDIPDEPPEQPEIPEEPAETPDIPEPAPSPIETAPQTGATVVTPPEEEGASLIVPGLTYRGRSESESALAWFGHAIECASINMRYDDYCADIGPVLLTEQEIQRLAPEAEQIWREWVAYRNRMDDQTIPDVGGNCEPLAGGNLGPSTCVDGGPRLRDLPAVQRILGGN